MYDEEENPMSDIMKRFQFGGKKSPKREVLSYSEQQLLFLAKKNNLKGTGGEDDPIIIDSSEVFSSRS